jgi:hypothetical protein
MMTLAGTARRLEPALTMQAIGREVHGAFG